MSAGCPAVVPMVRPQLRRTPSLVRATLARRGSASVIRGQFVAVNLESTSRIVSLNRSVVWCRQYVGLAGLFRKDRGPSKELGRALCDEVKTRFGCDGFFTTDELPRYGISRASRRAILAAVGASESDCVAVYAYPEDDARAIDEYLNSRLVAMLN